MKKEITVNSALIVDWCETKGTKEELAYKAECSHSMVQKMCSGNYRSVPSKPLRRRIAEVIGVSEAELFPVVELASEDNGSAA